MTNEQGLLLYAQNMIRNNKNSIPNAPWVKGAVDAIMEGDFLRTVFIHELGHCVIFSFNLLYDIHKMVEPYFWVEAEEWICNFLADYGMLIFDTAYSVLGDEAIGVVINQMEQLVA